MTFVSTKSLKIRTLRHFASFLSWRKLHITDSGFLLLVTILVGVLAGIAAAALKWMIRGVTSVSTALLSMHHGEWLAIALPVIGFTLSAIFCRYIIKDNVANGVAKLVADLKNNQYRLTNRDIFGSMIASSLTLGFGGTAGSEGPIAYTGAGIGSRLGRLFRLTPQMMFILLGCGAAAGIAGIFKAPIGGALFTLEVLRIELSTIAIVGLFLATLAAALVAFALSGFTFDINVVNPGSFDLSVIPWVLAMGVVCGLYAWYYTDSGGTTKAFLIRCSRPWVQWVSSGLMVGVMILVFPAMRGEGYGVITSILNGHGSELMEEGLLSEFNHSPVLLIIICGGILLFKGIGSSATNNGGGVAGDFAPTLFAGCILGFLFALTVNTLGWGSLNGTHFALMGMAGSMAGIIRAPLMSIFLTTEMIGGTTFLLPVTIVALIAYGMLMILKGNTFYHSAPFPS